MKYVGENLDKEYGFFIKTNCVFGKKSKYQKIQILENKKFGKILRLDDNFQTSEKDEYLYHEPLIHVPFITHPNPKKVLIIGGGDCGALKQAIKYNIKKIDLVEIDEEVIKVSKKYLKKIHEESYKDKRVNIIVEDGIKFLNKTKENYDIIILDLTDPGPLAIFLYTNKFYDLIKSKLNKNGIVTLHTETPYMVDKIHIRIIKTLMKSFKYVQPYYNYIPIYGTVMGFALCSNKKPLVTKKIFEKRIKKIRKLKMFNYDSYMSMRNIPKYIIEQLKNKGNKIITEKSVIKDYEELDSVELKIEKRLEKSS